MQILRVLALGIIRSPGEEWCVRRRREPAPLAKAALKDVDSRLRGNDGREAGNDSFIGSEGVEFALAWESLHCPTHHAASYTAKVRASHGTTTEQILQPCREGPGASVREEPEAPATTTQRLAADMRTLTMPLGSQLLLVGF